ncbi:MAG: shikimate dehydrogenase [Nitrospirota bacterium]
MMITGKTKIIGIFGYPVEHTLSPYMHNAAFEAMGLDYCYIPFRVRPENLKTAINSIKALSLQGVNITIPHKEAIIPYLDELDREAELIGAVNTVLNKEKRLIGYNTDGRGFVRSLREDGRIDPRGKKIMIIGAGGAARAIAFTLAIEGAGKIFIKDIIEEKAKELSSAISNKISAEAIYIKDLKDRIGDVDILINATPLGMKKEDPLPVLPELLSQGLIVYDIVYNPPETPLLKEAKKRGAKTLGGLGMLLYQGALSFKIWTGQEPPVDVMRKELENKIV